MTEPLIVSTQGFYSCDLGNDAVFERDPRFIGNGYLAGEAPHGLTTVYGDPVSADVRVYWRDPDNPLAQDVLVGLTTSAPDGTWRITGLNPDLQYVVRGRKAGYDDVSVVGAVPTRTDVVTATGSFVTNTDKNGVDGTVLIEGGLPPYAVSQVLPLPFGLEPVIDGHELTIPGTSDDGGLWDSLLRVTASNGVFVDVPVVVEIAVVLVDKHWDKVISLLHFDGDLTDETGRVWGGSFIPAIKPGIGGTLALDKTARISTPDSANSAPTPWVFYENEATLEFFLQRDSSGDSGNVISLWSGNIRFKCEIVSSELVFTAYIGGIRTMTFDLPFINNNFEHIALVKNSAGVFNLFRGGVMLPTQYGPFTGAMYAGTGGNVTCGGVTIDELRITKGVARYTADFTPPTAPFLSR